MKKDSECRSCEPEFNIKYRIVYILFATLITSLVLFQYSGTLSFLPNSTVGRESILAIGQIGFQSFFLLGMNRKKSLNYIGNLITVSLMGSLLLLPILTINYIITLPSIVLLGWFGITVSIMFAEHYRQG